MPLGIGIGQAIGLVREARKIEGSSGYVAVSGVGAHELAAALAAGGDRGAVAVDGDPVRAAVAIRLVDGEPGAAETAVLRQISSAGTPLLVVRRGGAQRLPYVLPGDVLEVGGRSCRSPRSWPRWRASRVSRARLWRPACRCSGLPSHDG